MSKKFKIGDIVVTNIGAVHKVAGFTKGLRHIPDGWLLDGDGHFINPKYCRKYEGALSAVEGC